MRSIDEYYNGIDEFEKGMELRKNGKIQNSKRAVSINAKVDILIR